MSLNMKKLVFIAGDGFSISFRRHLGIGDAILTRYLIPPPPNIIFRPRHEGDPSIGPLWREDVFPDLFVKWEERTRDLRIADPFERYWDFIRYMTAIPPPRMPEEDGTFTFVTMGSHAELRSYIWHLFTEYDLVIRDALFNRLGENEDVEAIQDFYHNWEWGAVIHRINSEFECSYISYNYDLILERVLSALGFTIISPTSKEQFPGIASRETLVLKPHGSINFYTDFGLYQPKTEPLHNFALYTKIKGFSTWPRADYQEIRPSIFDVVPPGHWGPGHITNPFFNIDDLCRDVIASADVIILCGLSAADPDTPEIDALLSHAAKGSLAIHVGLDGDSENIAAKLLRKHCGAYEFVRVGQTAGLVMPEMLWQLGKDGVDHGTGEPRKTLDKIVIDIVQNYSFGRLDAAGNKLPLGTMILLLVNLSGETVKNVRFIWLLKDPGSGSLLQVSPAWFNLNFQINYGSFDIGPGGRVGVPLIVAELPFQRESELSLIQDNTFYSDIPGDIVMVPPSVEEITAHLIIIDEDEKIWSTVEVVTDVNRVEGIMTFKFRHKGEAIFSTLVWHVNG